MRSIFFLTLVLVSSSFLTSQDASEGNSHRPVYFPDGEEILFMSNRLDGDWELFRRRIDAGPAQRLTEHVGWDGYADISPDGNRMVFDRSDDADKGIVIADLTTGAEEWLLRSDGHFLGGARFAPDGRSVIYSSEQHGNREVYRLHLHDRRVERLTHTDTNEGDAVLSPSGALIAYAVSGADEGSALEILDLHHQTTHRVLTTSGRLYGVSWTHDGRNLLFNDDTDGDQEIYITDLDGNDVRKLTDNDTSDHLPVAAPHADEFIFTSERDGTERVYIMDLTTDATRRVDVR